MRSAYLKRLKHIHDYLSEHTMQRKLGFTGLILVIMAGLLINTRFVPTKSKYTDTPIKTAETIGSSDTSVTMTSRQYNANQKFMVIRFTVKAGQGQMLDPKNMKFEVATIKQQDAHFEVLPLANNHYVLLLTNLQKGYQAIRIRAINKQPNIQALQEKANGVGDSSSSSDSAAVTQNKNYTDFVINEDTKFIHNKLLKLSRTQYAINSLTGSISNIDKKIKLQKSLIGAYEKQIEADKSAVATNNQDAQYQANKNSTSEKTATAQSDIDTQNQNIKDSKKKIKNYKLQKKLYQKQINAVQDGSYHFKGSSSTGEIK